LRTKRIAALAQRQSAVSPAKANANLVAAPARRAAVAKPATLPLQAFTVGARGSVTGLFPSHKEKAQTKTRRKARREGAMANRVFVEQQPRREGRAGEKTRRSREKQRPYRQAEPFVLAKAMAWQKNGNLNVRVARGKPRSNLVASVKEPRRTRIVPRRTQ